MSRRACALPTLLPGCASTLACAQTKPVVDYYAKQGLYSPVDANQKADTVKAAIAAILSK